MGAVTTVIETPTTTGAPGSSLGSREHRLAVALGFFVELQASFEWDSPERFVGVVTSSHQDRPFPPAPRCSP